MLSIAILGLALIAVNASAQSETEKGEERHSKVNDRVVLEDNSSLQENISSPIYTSKPGATVWAITSPVVKRELPVSVVVSEKDVKRNESPSTLSFNIFLYIVDKFKAD